MSEQDVLPAPDIETAPKSKWEREHRAFQQLLPTLLESYEGKFVAIHNEQFVESGDDQIEVATRAYKKYGYQPIYVGLVSKEPQPPVRIPSPRLDRGSGRR